MARNKFYLILKKNVCDNGDLAPADRCSEGRPPMNMTQDRCKRIATMTKNVNIGKSMIPYYYKFEQKLKQ